MTFRFSRQGLTPREQVLERALEILPGATSWTILVGMVGFAFWNPLLAALPALDAQTRLMVGRYLEFWVTEKPRPGEG